jgi:hypothetical protein
VSLFFFFKQRAAQASEPAISLTENPRFIFKSQPAAFTAAFALQDANSMSVVAAKGNWQVSP